MGIAKELAGRFFEGRNFIFTDAYLHLDWLDARGVISTFLLVSGSQGPGDVKVDGWSSQPIGCPRVWFAGRSGGCARSRWPSPRPRLAHPVSLTRARREARDKIGLTWRPRRRSTRTMALGTTLNHRAGVYTFREKEDA